MSALKQEADRIFASFSAYRMDLSLFAAPNPLENRLFLVNVTMPHYLSSQCGVRFSMKAPMPSAASRATMFATMTCVAYR